MPNTVVYEGTIYDPVLDGESWMLQVGMSEYMSLRDFFEEVFDSIWEAEKTQRRVRVTVEEVEMV